MCKLKDAISMTHTEKEECSLEKRYVSVFAPKKAFSTKLSFLCDSTKSKCKKPKEIIALFKTLKINYCRKGLIPFLANFLSVKLTNFCEALSQEEPFFSLN